MNGPVWTAAAIGAAHGAAECGVLLQADRELRIVSKGQERVFERNGVPAETVKRIPVGGGLGVLVGFAAGAVLYARLSRPRDDGLADPEDESEAT